MTAVEPTPTSSAAEAAFEALRLVEASPARARRLAEDARDTAAATGDFASASSAERALGLVSMKLDDYGAALVHLRRAVRLAERCGDSVRAGEAAMTLSLVFTHRGNMDRALREVDTATASLHGVEAARAVMQRGLILQHLGRLAESLEEYRRALPVLRRAGDALVEARLLCNRGVVHAYRGELAAAEADLLASERLREQLGQELGLAITRQNLGFVAMLRGDIPRALRYYDDAAELYGAAGAVPAVLHLDRCEAFLSVRLAHEARQAAEQAVATLKRGQMGADLAEARLALAEAALAEGDWEVARTSAARARRELARQRRPRWAALARYICVKAEWRSGTRSPALVRSATTVADVLADAGWPVPAADSRLIAARTALELGRVDEAKRILAALRVGRLRGPAELRARAWYAEALTRLVDGNRGGADRALRAGVRVLDEHRASIGARELRTHVSARGVELSALGLRLAFESGSPLRALAWCERGRGGGLLLPPTRPPADERLARDLSALRALANELEDAVLAGGETRQLARKQAALERAIKHRFRSAGADGTTPTAELPAVADLAARLGERALVELVDLDASLHAITLVDGRAALHALGPTAEVVFYLEALRFALRRLALRPGTAAHASTLASALDSAAELDARILRPLQHVLADRGLVLVPTGQLHDVPWSLLPTCRGRPLTVAPSARLWFEAAGAPAGRGRAVFAAGPGLAAAEDEVLMLAAHHPAARVLVGPAARADAVRIALDGADLAHVAAHGTFRTDNPLFSSLRLADGPLTVYDLETLTAAPRLVVLAACESGLTAVHPGDELMGLAASFLTLGTRSLIASVLVVPDAETHLLMEGLHARLRAGVEPSRALSEAQADVAAGSDVGLVTAAGFLCYGAG